ncbi:MAG TPA: ATP-binding protein, partial [Blastocatellia bacterium]|nr:ATP-binding protein [Blastocatellia bacterium]
MLDLHNPFADYGNLIYGDRFIGRQDYLQEIESRVIRSPGGNFAIIGQRRVGKSSLTYQAVKVRRDELLQREILPIRISAGSYNTSQQFFCSLVSDCFRELSDLDWASRRIREAAEEVKARDTGRFDFSEVKIFFKETHAAGKRIIILLDEFDKAARFFAGDGSFFDRLRDLSYRGQTTLLTVSRDPIAVIEQKSNVTSTLVGTIRERYLGMFGESEMGEHFDRLMRVGVALTDEHRREITARCGGHPFLHDTVAFELVELLRHKEKTLLGEAFQRSES